MLLLLILSIASNINFQTSVSDYEPAILQVLFKFSESDQDHFLSLWIEQLQSCWPPQCKTAVLDLLCKLSTQPHGHQQSASWVEFSHCCYFNITWLNKFPPASWPKCHVIWRRYKWVHNQKLNCSFLAIHYLFTLPEDKHHKSEVQIRLLCMALLRLHKDIWLGSCLSLSLRQIPRYGKMQTFLS